MAERNSKGATIGKSKLPDLLRVDVGITKKRFDELQKYLRDQAPSHTHFVQTIPISDEVEVDIAPACERRTRIHSCDLTLGLSGCTCQRPYGHRGEHRCECSHKWGSKS